MRELQARLVTGSTRNVQGEDERSIDEKNSALSDVSPTSEVMSHPEHGGVVDEDSASIDVDVANLAGDWFHVETGNYIATIFGKRLHWDDGRETPLHIEGNKIVMHLEGENYIGKIVIGSDEEQELVYLIYWSDGDVWELLNNMDYQGISGQDEQESSPRLGSGDKQLSGEEEDVEVQNVMSGRATEMSAPSTQGSRMP